jgi:cysteine dioxygenase
MATPILKLFAELDEDLKNDPNGPNCKEILGKYIKEGHSDWKEYVHFNDIKYARNLVDKTERLELILLCWKAGQVSPIHNHEVYFRPARIDLECLQLFL